MKTSGIKMKSIVFVSLYLLLSNTALQAFGQSKEDLLGKWKLERVSAIKDNNQIAIGMDSFDFEIPSEIDIQQEEFTFVRTSSTDKAKYNEIVKGNLFCFPICATWKITEGKLQLQWGQDIAGPSGDPEIRTVVLSYSRK